MKVVTLMMVLVAGFVVSSAEAKNCSRGSCRGSAGMPVCCATTGCTTATCCCKGKCQNCPSANCQCSTTGSSTTSSAARTAPSVRKLSPRR